MSTVVPRPVSRTATVVRSVVRVYRDRDVPFLAGSVAYAAFVSLIPLVLLLLIAASVFGGDLLEQYLLTVTKRYLTPTALEVVETSVTQAANLAEFSFLGLAALLWAVLKVFRTLDKAFSEIYRTPTHSGLVHQFADGVVVLGAMTMAILTMVAVGAVVAVLPSLPISVGSPLAVRAATLAALVAGLAVAFLPIYYVFPDVSVSLAEVVPGALVAAVGWALLQTVFQVYVSMTSASKLYGFVGGVILFITWLYFGAVIVLLGAATNAVLSGRDRSLTGASSDAAPPGPSRGT